MQHNIIIKDIKVNIQNNIPQFPNGNKTTTKWMPLGKSPTCKVLT